MSVVDSHRISSFILHNYSCDFKLFHFFQNKMFTVAEDRTLACSVDTCVSLKLSLGHGLLTTTDFMMQFGNEANMV